MANNDLLDFTQKFINKAEEEDKALWEQGHFFEGPAIELPITGKAIANSPTICGTSACVAGWGSLFAGWIQTRSAFLIAISGDRPHDYDLDVFGRRIQRDNNGNWWVEGITDMDTVVNPANGEILAMSAAARIEFGIDDSQADYLFSGGNSLDTVNGMIDALKADGTVYLYPYRKECLDDGCDCEGCRPSF